jgi:hypothetical protein
MTLAERVLASANPAYRLAAAQRPADEPLPPTAAAPVHAPVAAQAPALDVRPAEAPVLAIETEQVAAKQAPAVAPSSVDSMLDDALAAPAQRGATANRQAEALAPSGELPAAPSRDDVSQAMTVILPAIRGCAMGQTGLATAGILVRNDGRVASVDVTGAPFQGTASGRCMEGVVRRAHFPRFRQSTFRVQFPFAIQ